ncbi:PROTEIN KINASE FAMILY PROTEIN [Salix viminalis]|uniref:PROTEIN KINASE FAMILY PROTEIN n=1 Tax=Salix viminalis TaxID=40686 RepID=A0A9Q0NS04_SALVM|nr:PROTEIN KINASE FAMILY PROTEIN [Salix viminalis]
MRALRLEFLKTTLRVKSQRVVLQKIPASDAEAAQNVSKAASRWRGFFQLIRSRSKKSLATLHPLGVLKLSMRRSNSMRENIISNLFANSDSSSFKSPRINFTLSELQAATNNFSQENLIGKGRLC